MKMEKIQIKLPRTSHPSTGLSGTFHYNFKMLKEIASTPKNIQNAHLPPKMAFQMMSNRKTESEGF